MGDLDKGKNLLAPDPKRMIEGLRDTGYEFDTAIADIVDNSIAAEATDIALLVLMDMRGNIHVSIADNGLGMNRGALVEAMRYGAKERPNPASLGKYGLGLKTASTAFCRRLSVVSRASKDEALVMVTWDLDHVGALNEWDLLVSSEPDDEVIEHLESVASSSAGTVVVWNKVDRLLKDYDNPGGVYSQKALKGKVEKLKEHMSLVYQRFLDSDDSRARNVSITVNGDGLVAWDPFMVGYSELVADQNIEVRTPSGREAKFTVRAYILPREEEYPSPELYKLSKAAPNKQGMYIYRENRLIMDSTWLKMYKIETHIQLLRVEFSFDYKLDEAFHLDILKSQIILNDDLLKWLKDEFLPAPRREANNRSRKGQQKKIMEGSKDSHINSNTNIRNREIAAGGAKVSVINSESGEVEVENSKGKFVIKLPVESSGVSGGLFVQPVDDITHGLLFEPAIIDKNRAVKINISHPYYHKIYVPNLNESVTIQGMDALLWALCVAELTTINDTTSESFKDMRYEVSRILSKLVETLPDPNE
ncbi:MAG: hypothetical protein ACI9YE_001248 [Psychroserpens sp.]|jgi:hypothetical protein